MAKNKREEGVRERKRLNKKYKYNFHSLEAEEKKKYYWDDDRH